jgi:flavin reductase (DIM6/NTAB) family NADH-FMN oxidoreductase RutF
MAKKHIEPGPFIIPMPTVLVGAMVEGKPNFMTAAFVGIVNFRPPIIACGLSPTHLTCKGITANKAFSINIPPAEMVEKTDYCGLYSGTKVDKAGLFDLFHGDLEGAPMINECRLSAECKLIDSVPYEVDTMFLGEIVSIYADEEVAEDGNLDWAKINPLIFTFPDKGYWKLGDYLARAWKVGKGLKK